VSDTLTLRSRALNGDAVELVVRSTNGGTIERRHGAQDEIGVSAEMIVRVPAGTAVHGPFSYEAMLAQIAVDPLLDDPHDAALWAALASAETFGRDGLATVRVNGRVCEHASSSEEACFDPETLLELWLPSDDRSALGPDGVHDVDRDFSKWRIAPQVHYRGAPLRSAGAFLPREHLARVDIHARSARHMLLLSRDSLSREGSDWLQPRIRKLYAAHGSTRLVALRRQDSAPSLRSWLSLHLRHLGERDVAGTEWRAIVIARREGKALTLGDAFDAGALTISDTQPAELRVRSGEVYEVINGSQYYQVVMEGCALDTWGEHTLRADGKQSVSAPYLRGMLAAETTHGRLAMRRPHLPCPDVHASLAMVTPNDAPSFPEIRMRGWPVSVLLSPWTFRDDAVDLPSVARWVAWTANEYGGPPRNPSDVARALAAYLRNFDPDLRANPKLRVVYDLDAVLMDLAALYA